MNLKQINESFKRLYESPEELPTKETSLRTALEDAAEKVAKTQSMNIKDYEIAFQDTIEKFYPDHEWWEVCDLDIFNDLFNGRNVQGTIESILNNMKVAIAEPDAGSNISEEVKDSGYFKVTYDSNGVASAVMVKANSEEEAREVYNQIKGSKFPTIYGVVKLYPVEVETNKEKGMSCLN